MAVYDTTYGSHEHTRRRRKERKLPADNGRSMLAWQGALALTFGTASPPTMSSRLCFGNFPEIAKRRMPLRGGVFVERPKVAPASRIVDNAANFAVPTRDNA